MTFKIWGAKQDRTINAFADGRLLTFAFWQLPQHQFWAFPWKTVFISPVALHSLSTLTSCISKADNTQSVHNLELTKTVGEWYDSRKSASTDQDLAIIPCFLQFRKAGHHLWDVLIWLYGRLTGCLLGRVMRGRWNLACSSSWIFSTCLLNFRARRMDGIPLLNLWTGFLCHTSYLEYFTPRGPPEMSCKTEEIAEVSEIYWFVVISTDFKVL